METRRDLAIVLRTVVFEERHRVVTALSSTHGRVSCVARNSIQSRRFGGTLEPFVASEWTWVERETSELGRLDSTNLRRSYDGIRKSFQKLSRASAITEVILKVAPERDPCPDLFRLHSNALAWIEEHPEDDPGLSVLNFYLAKVLQWNGNQPQISACRSCGVSLLALAPDHRLAWIAAEAAWVCEGCQSSGNKHLNNREGAGFRQTLIRTSTQSALDLLLALDLPIRKALENAHASPDEASELFTLMEALLIYHLPGLDQSPLKSLRFIRPPELPPPGLR